ncbi:MAG: hypothetical protein ACERKN_18430 [Velocimicrobium sp.]
MLSFLHSRNEKKESITRIQRIEEKLEVQAREQSEQWSMLFENMQKMLQKQRKNDSVMESVFETIEEHADAFTLYETTKSNEKMLTGYIMEYDETLFQMGRMMKQAGAEMAEWAQQIEDMRKQVSNRMKTMDLIRIDDSNVPVDFKVHEIVSVERTIQFELQGMVHDIIVPGWIYKGEVLKKAKIIAYKLQEGTNE